MKITVERFGKPFSPGDERRSKRNSILSIILFLACALSATAIVTIIIEHLICCIVVPGQEETWAASVASYWGGILGGVISGVLAFLGVFYTIRYYKDSDAKKGESGDSAVPTRKSGKIIDRNFQKDLLLAKSQRVKKRKLEYPFKT